MRKDNAEMARKLRMLFNSSIRCIGTFPIQRTGIYISRQRGEMMMKRLMVTSVFLLAGISGEAMAACTPNTRITNDALATLISGKTVCAVSGSDKWQEYHKPGSDLIDWKRGANHPTDPTKKVGTWSTGGTGSNSRVTYNYGPGQVYSYAVHSVTGSTYTFCGDSPAPTLDVSLIAGQVSCGF